ncbi:MAG: cell division protein FtsL [Pseudomonadota bacterium]|jgi:cell division protein FtsL|nr:cell division protein FtsL [Pseudomonadota bacterium]
MLKLINATLVASVLFCSFLLYSQEHAVRDLERAIAKSEKQTVDEREKIKLLETEWDSLSRPDVIQKIAADQLHLQVIQPQQFVPLAEVGTHVPQSPPLKLEAHNSDEIGAMLEKMQ